MANKKFSLGMLALTLVFSLAVVACNMDPALNGTWTYTETNSYGNTRTETWTFNRGSYEYKYVYTYSDGRPSYTSGHKGTYTTSGGIITMTRTQTLSGTTWTSGTASTYSYVYYVKNGKFILVEDTINLTS
jgi:hypothetical protein